MNTQLNFIKYRFVYMLKLQPVVNELKTNDSSKPNKRDVINQTLMI